MISRLVTAFFGFVTPAYLTAAISGEQICARADTEHAAIGGILATSVIALSTALSWLLVAYRKCRPRRWGPPTGRPPTGLHASRADAGSGRALW